MRILSVVIEVTTKSIGIVIARAFYGNTSIPSTLWYNLSFHIKRSGLWRITLVHILPPPTTRHSIDSKWEYELYKLIALVSLLNRQISI